MEPAVGDSSGDLEVTFCSAKEEQEWSDTIVSGKNTSSDNDQLPKEAPSNKDQPPMKRRRCSLANTTNEDSHADEDDSEDDDDASNNQQHDEQEQDEHGKQQDKHEQKRDQQIFADHTPRKAASTRALPLSMSIARKLSLTFRFRLMQDTSTILDKINNTMTIETCDIQPLFDLSIYFLCTWWHV